MNNNYFGVSCIVRVSLQRDWASSFFLGNFIVVSATGLFLIAIWSVAKYCYTNISWLDLVIFSLIWFFLKKRAFKTFLIFFLAFLRVCLKEIVASLVYLRFLLNDQSNKRVILGGHQENVLLRSNRAVERILSQVF